MTRTKDSANSTRPLPSSKGTPIRGRGAGVAQIDLGCGQRHHGQTYVALSRCRSLEGIVFSRPLTPRDILFDERVHGFTRVFQPVPS